MTMLETPLLCPLRASPSGDESVQSAEAKPFAAVRRGLVRIATTAFIAVLATPALAVTPTASSDLSPSETVLFEGTVYGDHDVVVEAGGVGAPQIDDLGPVPKGVDVVAHHVVSPTEVLFVLDASVDLGAGVIAEPRKVVRWDGVSHSIAFDGTVLGLPRGASIDGLSRDGNEWLLSLDITAVLGGVTAADEDVVAWTAGVYSLRFDGSQQGVDPTLDVDGVHWFDDTGHLALSFDASGSVGGVVFDDEDVLEFDPGTGDFEMAWDGSSERPEWAATDVDSVHFVPEPAMWLSMVCGAVFLVLAGSTRKKTMNDRSLSAKALIMCLLLGLGGLGASDARASGGRIEINHARALAGGVTPGDGAGYPVTITESGSYVLTGNLTVTGTAHAISLAVGDVQIDLAGHEIVGPTVCTGTGAAISCPAVTSANGVSGSSRDGVRLHGGVIRGFLYGAYLGDEARVQDMSFTSNRYDGIRMGDFCLLNSSIASANGDEGLQVGRGCVVTDVNARWNGDDGITSLEDAVVTRSASQSNGGDGFQLTKGIVVGSVSAVFNGNEGIDIQKGAAVISSSSATSNGGRGIQVLANAAAEGSAAIVDNSSSFNTGNGINTGNGSVIIGNVLSNNVGTAIDCDGITGFFYGDEFSGRAGNFVTPATGTWSVGCENMNPIQWDVSDDASACPSGICNPFAGVSLCGLYPGQCNDEPPADEPAP